MSAEAEAKLFLVEEASPLGDQEPASSTPVTEEPASSTPVTEEPAPSTPVTEKPVSSTPVTEEPASSTPVTEKPVSSPVNEECGQKMHPDEQDKQVVEQGGE